MSDLAAVPWPDAAGRSARTRPAAAPAEAVPRAGRRSPATFLLGVFTVLVFSGVWETFVTGPEMERGNGGLVIALFMPAYLSALVLLAGDVRASLRAAAAVPALWALLAVACASVLWSVAPQLTVRRTPAIVMTSLAGVALAARYDWEELSEVLATSFAVIVVGSFLMALLLPSWGRMVHLFPGAWRGFWYEKNALGDRMAAAVCLFAAAAALNPRRRMLWSGFALGALALIVLSTSKTSLVTLLLGLAALAMVALVRRGGAVAVLAVFAAVSVLAGVAFVMAFEREALFRLLGKDATLTGRTGIWAGALRQIAQRPWLGFGYSAVWDDPDVWGPIHWIMKDAKYRPPHAHNAWIELRLALGWTGLACFAVHFGQAWVRALVAFFRGGRAGRGAWLAAPFLAVWTVQSLTESIALNYNDSTWVMLTAIAASLGLRRSAPALRAEAVAEPVSMAAP